jgi:hypothetical protein
MRGKKTWKNYALSITDRILSAYHNVLTTNKHKKKKKKTRNFK